ncbi:MAG: hypothetical protein AAF517_25440, partial [Planctomycetota bacterium]
MSSKKAQKPKRRLKKFLIRGGVVFAILGLLVLSVPSILSTDSVRESVVEALEESLDADVELESIEFSWFGGQELRGLRVRDPEGDYDLLRVPKVRVRQGLLGLWTEGRLEVEIDEPVLRARRARSEAEAKDPEAGSQDSEAGSSGGESEDEPKGGGGFELPIDIVLLVNNAECHFTDEESGTTSTVRDLNLRVDGSGDDVSVKLSAKVPNLENKSEKPGRISFEADVRGFASGMELGTAAVTARGKLQRINLSPYAALVRDFYGIEVPKKPI